MANVVHVAAAGQSSLCGVSILMHPVLSLDVSEVDCRECLWHAMAASLKTANLAAARLKVLTDATSIEGLVSGG